MILSWNFKIRPLALNVLMAQNVLLYARRCGQPANCTLKINLVSQSHTYLALQQHGTVLQLQKQLQDKQHELTTAYQTSLNLIESNNQLQRQMEVQAATIQTLEHKLADSETTVSGGSLRSEKRIIFLFCTRTPPCDMVCVPRSD